MSPKAAEPEAEPEEEAPEEPQEGSDSFQFADGSKFKGSWVMKDGVRVRQGHGVFTDGTIEGQTYEGEWADDMMEGRGTFVYASGAKYVGGFQANKYSGFGKFTFPDHSVYEGSFKARCPTETPRAVACPAGPAIGDGATTHHHGPACPRAAHSPLLLPPPAVLLVAGWPPLPPPAGLRHRLSHRPRCPRPQDNQMHGSGTYTDAQGVEWKGKFYNGTGPGLGHAQVIAK